MEEGTKKDPAQHTEKALLGKAGWVKKAHGRVLTSYKDRYIQLEKTDVGVYENEDLQNCLERLDLENYDQCHELKSPFKKKHRLILIRSSKCGNKVHDVKLQAQSVEEKEAWIKALSDGISRAKNKAFDEVKVESTNLEHVTRTRPKGNRNRRPPTRIHMKEVAIGSSDGLLRLDLDLEDAVMPNGTQSTSASWTETLKEEEEEGEPEASVQKKTIEPSILPTDAEEDTLAEDKSIHESPEKKVQSQPNEATSRASPDGEAVSDQIPAAKIHPGPPPTPPNKPSNTLRNLVVTLQPQRGSSLPSPSLAKEKLPDHPSEPEYQVDPTSTTESHQGKGCETDTRRAEETDGKGQLASVKGVEWGNLCDIQDSTESQSKSNSPLLTCKQNHEKSVQQKKPQFAHSNKTPTCSASDHPTRPLQAPKPPPKVPSEVLSSAEPPSNGLSQSPQLWKKTTGEEKSLSGSALNSSHQDVRVQKPAFKTKMKPEGIPDQSSSALKVRSASYENMLSNSFITSQMTHSNAAECAPPPGDEFTDLQAKVALEMENTRKLLNLAKEGGYEESSAEELLSQAMEKLRKADNVLQEIKKQKVQNRPSNRLSW
uniref:PH domain-containing protein n=1 Tax=Oryzias sinensis TaxID=183150 RepID=A0A8C7XPT7_9TELE